LKIGLFTDTYWPQVNGVATSVATLKESLTLQGHYVHVFTTTDPQAPGSEDDVYRVPSIAFARVGRRVGTLINPRLKQTVKELELDLIHTHTEFSLGILGRKTARALRMPLVHTMHTIYEDYTHYIIKTKSLTPLTKAFARKMTAAFCNSADQVIAPTNKTKDLLLAYGVNRSVAVIPTGLKLDKFAKNHCSPEQVRQIRTKFNLAQDDKVIVNIGRLAAEKNLDEIIYALQNYLPRHPDVKLLLVGDGPAKKQLKSLTLTLSLEQQIIFAGEQPWADIGLYYQLGELFVSASQSETQGLTYIEALAAGLPILAKADPCLENVLQNGVNGYVFQDREDFISLLDRILHDRQHRESLSKEALRLSKPFSAASFGHAVALLYESLLYGKAAYLPAAEALKSRHYQQ